MLPLRHRELATASKYYKVHCHDMRLVYDDGWGSSQSSLSVPACKEMHIHRAGADRSSLTRGKLLGRGAPLLHMAPCCQQWKGVRPASSKRQWALGLVHICPTRVQVQQWWPALGRQTIITQGAVLAMVKKASDLPAADGNGLSAIYAQIDCSAFCGDQRLTGSPSPCRAPCW